MKTKSEVKQAMADVNSTLISVKLALDEINKTEQFDYVTDSMLSTYTDNIARLSKQINKIVYQS